MKRLLLALMLLGAIYGLAEAPRPSKPNVVLILVDDLGWQDVTCYDIDEPTPMETPNLDKLASKGVKFWQGYSPAPTCAPSRAAILSGHHPVRGEMTHVSGGFPPYPGHPTGTPFFSPWYSSRVPTNTYMLAEAMKDEGYVTGHSGKWHISKHHYAYPNAYHHGFDYSVHERGVQVYMKPDRLTGFATRDPDDPYRLDENGYPYDEPHQGAMDFIKDNCDKPFFLYYATWLVHAPWVMRSEALLRKYEKKLGVEITEQHKERWDVLGQKNPFYCAMVEQLDYYLGQLFTYLEETSDPRWPGHTLMENTYIIFTSDNGGTERDHTVTDNVPLDRGKISVKEGGVRVPLIITGPQIPPGRESDVMVNGLDFYPTILSWIGADRTAHTQLDGCDLSVLLKGDVKDPTLVRDAKGKVRDTMFWHFPQAENTSTIRVGDYKLLRRYAPGDAILELYQLYGSGDERPVRKDIEEMNNLAEKMPDKAAELDARLTDLIDEMGGRRPYFNPNYSGKLAHKEKAPNILSMVQKGRRVEVLYRNNGAKLLMADLLYTDKGGDRNEEWRRVSAELHEGGRVTAELPPGTTHYFINLIDENNFLVSYPKIDGVKIRKDMVPFSSMAQFAGYPEPEQGDPVNLEAVFQRLISGGGDSTVLLSENFETEGSCSLPASGAGVSIEAGIAGSSRTLRLFEAKEFPQDWVPHVSQKIEIPESCTSGVFRAAFDVRLDPEAPGKLGFSLRGTSGDCSILFGESVLTAAGWSVVSVEPGIWYHVEMAMEMGPSRNRVIDLSAVSADGKHIRTSIPYENHHFNHPTSLSISGLGALNSSVYLDHLVLRVESKP